MGQTSNQRHKRACAFVSHVDPPLILLSRVLDHPCNYSVQHVEIQPHPRLLLPWPTYLPRWCKLPTVQYARNAGETALAKPPRPDPFALLTFCCRLIMRFLDLVPDACLSLSNSLPSLAMSYTIPRFIRWSLSGDSVEKPGANRSYISGGTSFPSLRPFSSQCEIGRASCRERV